MMNAVGFWTSYAMTVYTLVFLCLDGVYIAYSSMFTLLPLQSFFACLSFVAYTYTFHLHHVIIHSGTYLSFLESYLLIISINPLRSALLTTFFL
ncbi:hypothetical protein BDP27DRAFT_1326370 [Rhodocollybia butyracea]|uniref:Uncharacterized protein n=1 Tax=Rhodocollybia butyracea TaxID=206335 RepID=A0A9P5U7B8_9AGAR|nr:hypothetical protein BDP27DRAFT_1326370 [Rhodocollybia butyracea]